MSSRAFKRLLIRWGAIALLWLSGFLLWRATGASYSKSILLSVVLPGLMLGYVFAVSRVVRRRRGRRTGAG